MSQETMNVALPQSLKEYVVRQVSEGSYSSASEYIRELIRCDQKQKAQERLEAMLLQGLESGESREFGGSNWSELKQRVLQRDRVRGDKP